MQTAHPKTDHHATPLKIYLGTGAALLFLTAVTVAVSQINLGGLNVVVALGIATLKASLVVLFFMHLLYDKKIYLIVFLISVIFLGVFLILTMFDTMERGTMYEILAEPINPEAVIYQNQPPDSVAPSGSGGH